MQGTARYLLVVLLTALSGLASAGSPRLVLDINAQYTPLGSNPVWLGKLGNQTYFIARPVPGTFEDGTALFKTDGTAAGTTQVARIDGFGVNPYGAGTIFIAAGNKAYFLAATTAAGQEVWVTDGTAAGTHLVVDTYPGPNSGDSKLLGLVGTDLIFAARPAEESMQLFRTDGTAAGTRVLSNFVPGRYGRVRESLAVGGKVYVTLESTQSCCQPDLWVTDGTTSGTTQIDSDEGYPWHLQPSSLRAFGNSVAMLTNTPNRGVELSLVDTATNALTILETVAGPGNGASYGSTIASMDGFILYLRGNGNIGLQLWRSDGTLVGTTLVQDFGPGVQVSYVGSNIEVTRVGNRAVFLTESAQHGPELWSSDGTAQGTVELIPAPVPAGAVNPLLGVVGTHAYYAIYTGADYRVVVTDGTVANTHILAGAGPLDAVGLRNTQVAGNDTLAFIHTYYFDDTSLTTKHLLSYSPQLNGLARLRDTVLTGVDNPPFFDGERLFFMSSDTTRGEEPWVTDGTGAGTRILANLAQEIRSNDSNPRNLTDVNGTVYFTADDGVHGLELWKSDGTANGTSLAFDIGPGEVGSNPTQLTSWSDSLYFFTGNSYVGALRRTTGPLSAVAILGALTPIPRPSDPNFLETQCYFPRAVPLNGRLYFGASDGTSGFELWSTDGTSGGTTQLADIAPGYESSAPCSLTVFKGRLYFRARRGSSSGYELWSTDGTAAGTGPALAGAPYAQFGGGSFIVFNERMYFVASDAKGILGVYSTDGTGAGTQLLEAAASASVGALSPTAVSNGRLVLLGAFSNVTSQREIWVSDGTPAGTVQLTGVNIPASAPLAITSNLIYFMNSDGTAIRPWVSDGTAAGTRLLADLNPGGDSDVRWFADFHGAVYLATNDAANGARIWRTNGTTVGTVPVGSSAFTASLGPLLVSGQNLFFAGDDSTAGLELNVVSNDSPKAADDSATSVNGAAVTLNVLANDVDADGSVDPATVRIVSAPAHGSASVTPSGSVVYTPTSGYQGTDTVTYSAADNQAAPSNAATVTVTTTQPPPTPPPPQPSGGTGGGGGGGGAMGLWELLALGGLIALRMRPRRCLSRISYNR